MRLAGFLLCLAIGGGAASSQTIDPRDRDFWNGKYSESKPGFNHQQSRLLVDAIAGRTPGAAIDLGMGQGRNAIFLAQRGWKVTGVDLSDVAVAQANKRAAGLGVKLTTAIDDLDHYDFGHSRWDLITLFYMHAWFRGSSPRSAQRIVEALRPGGLLVIEGFAGSEKYMFQTNELLRDFDKLRILRYEDTEAEADWAPGEKSHIILAEKRR